MEPGQVARPRANLRDLLARDDLVVAPGVWDGISSAIAESLHYPVVFSAGWAISAAVGLPDAELYSRADNLNAVRVIAATTSAAIVADIDGGYGNPVNVYYAIRDFEAAGVSAMLMEDQVSPKRCNYAVDRVELNDLGTATSKIRAAADARQSPTTMIIARTDAVGDEIFRRAEAYVEAGADMICPIAVSQDFGVEQWAKLHTAIDKPLMAALVPGFWQERELSRAVMTEVGIRFVTCGLHPLYAAAEALKTSMSRLLAGESPADLTPSCMSHEEFGAVIGFDEVRRLEQKYVAAGVN